MGIAADSSEHGKIVDALPSVGAYYPWLDALRGGCWILVVVGHTTCYSFLARMGVAIFFATSGWLITKIIVGQGESTGSLTRFYTRRCLRILPLYYLLVVIAIVSSYCFPGWRSYFTFRHPDCGEYQLWPYLLTFATESWRGGGGGVLIGHCWSLCVEERFYVFWPLLLSVCPRGLNARRALVVLLIAIWCTALGRLHIRALTTALWAMPLPLLLGCALALLLPRARWTTPKYVSLPLALMLFCLFVAYAVHVEPRFGPTICTFSLTAGLLAAGLVACALYCAGEPRSAPARLLQWLGKLSYAAYLFHIIFALIGMEAARIIGCQWIAPVIAIALCVPVAYVAHRGIERPILGLRHTVEGSARWRCLCTGLQVLPISVGLLVLFPWSELAQRVATLPNLLPLAAGLAVFAAAAVAYVIPRVSRRAFLTRLHQTAPD
jgi:peptidoglycan/LPS O-acetylase OafA/YrhL